jgi:hypothetical protein
MVDQSGNSAAITSSLIVGYESKAIIGRICMPVDAVFTNSFKSFATTFSSSLQQGDLANFISDLKNVDLINNIELAMATRGIRVRLTNVIHLYDFFTLPSRINHLGVYLRNHPILCRSRFDFLIQCG